MSSWLTVLAAIVTCLSLSSVTCLPLRDVAGGGQRRELLRSTWGNPSGRGSDTRNAVAQAQAQGAVPPASLLLDQSRAGADDAGAVLDLLLALGREGALYGGDGLAFDDGGAGGNGKDDAEEGVANGEEEEEEEAAGVDKRGKPKVDDYGHGMFWGKRDGGPSWLGAGRQQQQQQLAGETGRAGDRGQALMTKRGHDDYGFGLFFGKRGRPDFEEDFPL